MDWHMIGSFVWLFIIGIICIFVLLWPEDDGRKGPR